MTAVQLTDRHDYCFTCTQGKKVLSVSVWDVRTGITLRIFSSDTGSSQGAGQGVWVGGAAALCLLGETHLMCAPKAIPFIYVWNLRKEQVMLKIACAGIVRALCCSPDSVYCAGGIAERIYIWHVCTGDLLAVLSQHYQPVTVLWFTDDGVHFVSGAEDGRVIVWKLVDVVSQAQASMFNECSSSHATALTSPSSSLTRHIWADHTLPVTDLHCGKGGLHSRIFTSSLDQTCKVYELISGHLLCSIFFDFGLTCMAVHLAEQWLFVGGSTGKICRINLYTKPMGPDIGEGKMHYTGHSKAISGLAIASWANVLVSTSLLEDTARVWDIVSNQTLREVKLKGPISKMSLSGGLFQSLSKQQHLFSTMPNSVAPVVKVFKKQIKIHSEEERSSQPAISFPIQLRGIDPLSDLACFSELQSMYFPSELSTSNSSEKDFALLSAKQELAELKDVHKKLYTFCTDKLIA